MTNQLTDPQWSQDFLNLPPRARVISRVEAPQWTEGFLAGLEVRRQFSVVEFRRNADSGAGGRAAATV